MEPRLKTVKPYSPPATYSQQVSVYCDRPGRCQPIRLAWRCLHVRPAGAAVCTCSDGLYRPRTLCSGSRQRLYVPF